ncbi:histidine phosphatase family protein [bacterium]|nr:histidine phosphatase family protein [bacterium]
MSITFPRRRRIYLMRHGEVQYFDGTGQPFRPDEVPLTDRGHAQAAAAREWIARVELDRAIVSPLRRTKETAAGVLGSRDLPVIEMEDLKEISPGKLRDLPMDPASIQRIFTQAFGVSLTPDETFLGGETFGSLLARIDRAIERLLADDSWKNLLIVAHGGVNRAILARALGSGLASFGRLEQEPCCLNIIDVDEQGRMLVRMINFSASNPIQLGSRLTTMEELFAQYLGIPTDETSGT